MSDDALNDPLRNLAHAIMTPVMDEVNRLQQENERLQKAYDAAQKDRDEWKERTECYEDIEVQQAEWMKRNKITYEYDFTDGLSKVIDERDEQADRIRILESLLRRMLELSEEGLCIDEHDADRIRAALDAKKRDGR